MNSDFSDREPLPGAWRIKGPPPEYFKEEPILRDRYDYAGRGEVEQYDRGGSSSYDRYNGNQPVFPPAEDRLIAASRKRAAPSSETASFYTKKLPRSTDPYPPTNPRYLGDSSQILQEESRKCIAEISQELAVIESSQSSDMAYLTHTKRILQDEIAKITSNTNPDWLDVESTKYPIKILKRVLLPPTRPGSNVVGKLMGVGGATLRRLCQQYKCHISICGAGSRKNAQEEQDLLRSGDPRHSHLSCPLHAEVSTTGPPHMAYSRLSEILSLMNKIITTDESFEYDGIFFEANRRNAREDDDVAPRGRRGEHRGRPPRRPREDNYALPRESRPPREGRPTRDDRSPVREHPMSDHDAHSPRAQRYQERNSDGSEFRQTENGASENRASRGRGRGAGGFVPRGGVRGGGFIPRARDE